MGVPEVDARGDFKNVKSSFLFNMPRSICQYSNMAPRLSGQTFIFGVVSVFCIQVSFGN